MLCIRCHTPNPETNRFCSECGESFHSGTPGPRHDAVTETGESPDDTLAPTAAGTGPGADSRRGTLPRGFLLANRYEIERPLGMGGMGMVYRARDRELDVPVALKMIRDEYTGDDRVLERFKQEITIARRVTHRNVARIYDLGESEGLRYISMEYIEGQDLARVVEQKGPMPIEQALSVLRQICAALKEAHASGVVHRDLKPHNVMLDDAGGAHVMDFGIAMVSDARGMTRTGALIGTPEYMSPEQAEGRKVDHRSDIYSLGILVYEILSGNAPFKGNTTWEVIKKQIEQRPQSIRRVRRDLPEWLDTLIMKCLEKDPALRYQSVGEILDDIDRQEAHLSVRHYLPSRRTLVLAVGLPALVAGAVGITLMMRPDVPVAGEGGRRSVAILPFENQTGRPDLDWLRTGLADNLTTDLAESKYFRVLSRERLSQILGELGLDATSRLDASALKRIGEFGGVEAVVTGSFLSLGDQIRVNLRVQDPGTGEIFKSTSLNGRESRVLGMIDELTLTTKRLFELTPDRLAGDSDLELASARTSSVEAASLFQKGVDLLARGQNLEAVRPLQEAVLADEGFAVAHARLAEAQMRTGRDREAAESIQKAMDRMLANPERIPQTDRTFIRALSGRISNRPEESIRAYEEMLVADPDDPAVAFSIGEAYETTGDYDAARRYYLRAVEHDAKNPGLRFALGRVRIKAGNPEEALPDLQAALELYALMGSDEGQGSALNAIAYVDDALGRSEEALADYGRAEQIERRIGDKQGLAKTLNNKAGLLQRQGRLAEASRISEESLTLYREIGDTGGTAAILANLGSLREESGDPRGMLERNEEALALYRTLKDRAGQMNCLIGLSRAHASLGLLTQAKADLDAADAIAGEIGDEADLAWLQSERSSLDYLGGDLDAAARGQSRALEGWAAARRNDGVAEASLRLAQVEQARGRHGAARPLLEEALRVYSDAGDATNLARTRLAMARSSLDLGDVSTAARLLDGLAESLSALDNPVLIAHSTYLRALAEARSGKPDAAARLADQVCTAAGRTSAIQSSIHCDLARCLSAPPEDAIAAALAAATRAADGGLKLELAAAEVALARAYERAGQRRQANARGRDAYETARSIGATGLALGAAPLAAGGAWEAGRREEAVTLLAGAIERSAEMEKDLDPASIRGLREAPETSRAIRLLADYLKALGRPREASAYLARIDG